MVKIPIKPKLGVTGRGLLSDDYKSPAQKAYEQRVQAKIAAEEIAYQQDLEFLKVIPQADKLHAWANGIFTFGETATVCGLAVGELEYRVGNGEIYPRERNITGKNFQEFDFLVQEVARFLRSINRLSNNEVECRVLRLYFSFAGVQIKRGSSDAQNDDDQVRSICQKNKKITRHDTTDEEQGASPVANGAQTESDLPLPPAAPVATVGQLPTLSPAAKTSSLSKKEIDDAYKKWGDYYGGLDQSRERQAGHIGMLKFTDKKQYQICDIVFPQKKHLSKNSRSKAITDYKTLVQKIAKREKLPCPPDWEA